MKWAIRHSRSLFFILVVVLGISASTLRSVRVESFSGVDEAQHWDSVIKYSRIEIPRYEGALDRKVVNAISCHDIDPVDDTPDRIHRGSTTCAPARFLSIVDAGPYEAGQPPLYYATTAVVERVFGTSSPGNVGVPKYLRFVNAVILALIIWVMAQIFTLLVRNRSSLDPSEAFSEDRASRQFVFVVALAAPLLLVVSPAMIESSGVVSNDLAAVLTSAACAWLYLRCQTAEPNTKLTTISGFGIGGVMALTKATTLVPVCVLAFLALVSLLSSERRRSDRQSLLFSFSVALSWVACTVGWSMLVDRLTRVPIKSLLVFQLWREPLPTVAWRAAKGIPLLTLRGAFGANADSVAFRLAEGLGWVLLLALPIAATAMIATRSRGSWQVAGIAAGVWCAGPVMALGTYLGTGKPHVDSRLLLSAVPWVLIALSISAQTAIHFRRSAVVALVTAATCTSLALISYGAYLVPLLT